MRFGCDNTKAWASRWLPDTRLQNQAPLTCSDTRLDKAVYYHWPLNNTEVRGTSQSKIPEHHWTYINLITASPLVLADLWKQCYPSVAGSPRLRKCSCEIQNTGFHPRFVESSDVNPRHPRAALLAGNPSAPTQPSNLRCPRVKLVSFQTAASVREAKASVEKDHDEDCRLVGGRCNEQRNLSRGLGLAAPRKVAFCTPPPNLKCYSHGLLWRTLQWP